MNQDEDNTFMINTGAPGSEFDPNIRYQQQEDDPEPELEKDSSTDHDEDVDMQKELDNYLAVDSEEARDEDFGC